MSEILMLEEFLEEVSIYFNIQVDENDSCEGLDIVVEDFKDFLEYKLEIEDMDRVSNYLSDSAKFFTIYDILFI